MTPLIVEPWARVKNPLPIPSGVRELHDLPLQQLAELVRGNLLPRPDNRAAWEWLWRSIDADNELADRVMDVLEYFLDTTEDALGSGRLDAAAQKRAKKFKDHCERGWTRLDRGNGLDPDEPLAWAGRAAKDFSPPARKVLQELVSAIAEHRQVIEQTEPGREPDQQLWAVLQRVSLDPRRARS